MAQKTGNEGSVAPKERVNIVYKTYTGDAEQEIELPFRFLVLGDFTGRPDATPIGERQPVSVDKDNFNAVLAAHDVNATLSVPNRLSQKEGDRLAGQLTFRSLKDFGPDSICQQVPELKAIVELRDALTVLKGPLGNMPAFRKRLQAVLEDPAAQKRLMAELKLDAEAENKK